MKFSKITLPSLLVFHLFLRCLWATSCDFEELVSKNFPKSGSSINRWLTWEIEETVPSWKQSQAVSQLPLARVPKNKVLIEHSSDVPQGVLSYFDLGTKVLWVKHPYNTNSEVPFFDASEVENEQPGHHTSSRSIVVVIDQKLYSLKLPTNFPFGRDGAEQKNKSTTYQDNALARSNLVGKIDERLGKDDRLIILREVLTVTDKATRNGFSLRDLSPLTDGHHYLPANQIPNFGDAIAKKNGVSFKDFWQKNWAEALGRAQARALIRYGIEAEAINPQNYLIQLDADLRPTGRIVYRDLSDSCLVAPVVKAANLTEELAQEKAFNVPLRPNASFRNSSDLTWRFEQSNAGKAQFSSRDLTRAWIAAHNRAYIHEIGELLSVSLSEITTVKELNLYLRSRAGQDAIRRFHGINPYRPN